MLGGICAFPLENAPRYSCQPLHSACRYFLSFEYVFKSIDIAGFEYVIRKEKKFTLKHLIHLNRSLEALSALLFDLDVSNPFSHFVYLKAFSQFVSMQREESAPGSVFLQLGIFTSSQTLAAINALAPEIKGEYTKKLEHALKEAGTPEKLALPVPVLSASLNGPCDDPTLLYNALYTAPECNDIQALLAEYNIPSDWLDH